jgi:hypothetical protein
MSQYPPSPYQPQQPQPPLAPLGYGGGYGAGDPTQAYLAPARRAAIGTFIVAGVTLLCGLCVGLLGVVANEQMLSEVVQNAGEAAVTTDIVRVVLIGMAVAVLIFGISMAVLGVFVWRGSAGAIITTIVITAVAVLVAVANSALSIPRLRGVKGGAELGGFLCVTVLIPVLLVGLLVMLFQALGGTRRLREAQAAYQAQYWQYQQQQQQMYAQQQQQPFPPPPPPPPPAPPPTQSPDEPPLGT